MSKQWSGRTLMVWLVLVLMLAVLGAVLWFHEATEGYRDWLLKFLLLATLFVIPVLFWDDLGTYWRSSEGGPIDIDTGSW